MFNFRKYLLKIEKLLRIERCYSCGRCIYWQKGRLKYIEDPDDLGFIAPACKSCQGFAEKHQYNY